MNINKLYSLILIKRFSRLLKKKGWSKFRTIPEQQLIVFGLSYKEVDHLQCFFDVSLDKDHCVLYLKREHSIQEEYRSRIAEYLTYANYGLVLGNFEFDLSDGEVRYKVSLPAGRNMGFFFSALPSLKALLHIVDVSISTIIRYGKGINSLLEDPSITPEYACAQVENRRSVSAADVIAQIDKLSVDEKRLVEAKLRESD